MRLESLKRKLEEMNSEEKKVLRRKRQTLVLHLKVSESHLERLIRSKYLTHDGADQIRAELSNQAKVNKLLELLPNTCGRLAFQALCDLLDTGDTSWLKDELLAEVKAAKGDLRIEEYIDRECAVLVYREFGNSKRLSEGEKKDMQLLVAKKTQCTKEAWRSQFLKTEEALAYENELNAEKDELSRTLIEKIRTFLKINTPRLRAGRRNSQTSPATMREVLQNGNDVGKEKPFLVVLDELIVDLQNLAMDGLLERDSLIDERTRSLHLLSVTDLSTKLDREIELALQDADHRLNESDREVDRHQTRAAALDSELKTTNFKWQREVEQRDITIRTLRQHLDTCHDKIRDLNETMENLKQELANTKDELAKYRNKSELLEKNRRLGYKHSPGSGLEKSATDLEKTVHAWRKVESRISTAKQPNGTVKKTSRKSTKVSKN